MVFVLTVFVIMKRFLATLRNMSNLSPLLLLIWLITGPIASAEQTSISPYQFLELMKGNTIIGEYQDGRQWDEMFKADGSTLYREDNYRIIGRVYSNAGKVCFSYPTAKSATGGCFEIWQRSANCFDFYGISDPPKSTDATERQKRLSIGWTARAWLSQFPSTCVSEQIS